MTRLVRLLSSLMLMAGSAGCAYDMTVEGKECDAENHPCPPGFVCTAQGDITVCKPGEPEDGGSQECSQDGECDDGDHCTVDSCVATRCENEPQTFPGAEGLTVEGTCTNEIDDDCDGLTDGDDSDCLPCVEGQDCNDGDDCTHTDTCTQGVCAGTSYSCDDENVCTDDVCNGDGTCSQFSNSELCDDLDPCTHSDACVEGTCSGTQYQCEDGNPCTDDICNGDNTCSHVNNTEACNDEDPCTHTDACSEGVCVGTGYYCDDENVCTDDSCNGDGTCSYTNVTDDCDDGDDCTHTDACADGSCAGVPYSCDDGNQCTDDNCDGQGNCSHVNNTGLCDDGLFCNGADACDGAGDCSMHAGNPCGVHNCDEDLDICEGVGEGVFTQLVVGYFHTCGLTAGGVAYCWGDDEYGQLGNGGSDDTSQIPVAVNTGPVVGQSAFIKLASGFYHTCGLTSEGVAYCWGWDLYGQLGDGGVSSDSQSPVAVDTDPILGEKTFVRLTGGGWHTCGLTSQGVAYCWGRDQYGQLGDGVPGDDSQSPVAVDITPITGEKALVGLSGGYYHSCAITSQGAAYCWGRDFEGQLGNGGTNDDSPLPVPVDTTSLAGQSTLVGLDGGGWHTCGRTSTGAAYCWGNDFNGQLGDGGVGSDSQSPVTVDLTPIAGEKVIVYLSGGGWHTCGLSSQGVAYCWGRDEYGQLGDGDLPNDSQSAVKVYSFAFPAMETLSWIEAGAYHSCGLTPTGAAYCWGRDDYGQLGDGGTANDSQIPVSVDTLAIAAGKTLVHLAAGGQHSCGLSPKGSAFCWGDDGAGQLGDGGVSADSQSPVAVDASAVAGEDVFVGLVSGGSHSCGRSSAGGVYCWGSDMKGQLGDGGNAADSQLPVALDTSTIGGAKAFVQLAAGKDHTCGLTCEGLAYCWGDDSKGQLGNGAAGQSLSPGEVDMSPLTGDQAFAVLAAGDDHTCGLSPEGIAYCWGSDSHGQLGNGADGDAEIPEPVDTAQVEGEKAMAQLTGGSAHTCGLTAEGVAYCWGFDDSGQLGNGALGDSETPVAVETSEIFVGITAGDKHTCGLTARGQVYCWGRDSHGQLGDGGTAVNSPIPVAIDLALITGQEAFAQLTGGGVHTCGLTAQGIAYCWGQDDRGQLGNGGTAEESQSPVPVDDSALKPE